MNRSSKMEPAARAKQFMPFDALKGFREALAQKERIIVSRRDLSEEQKEALNRKFWQLGRTEIVTVEFFQNGEYIKVTGMISAIDEIGRTITIVNTKIAVDDIVDLKKEEPEAIDCELPDI